MFKLKSVVTGMIASALVLGGYAVGSLSNNNNNVFVTAEETNIEETNPGVTYVDRKYIKRYSNTFTFLNKYSNTARKKCNYGIVTYPDGSIEIQVTKIESTNGTDSFEPIWFDDSIYDYSVELVTEKTNGKTISYVTNYDAPDGYNIGIETIITSSGLSGSQIGDGYKITLTPKVQGVVTKLKVFNSELSIDSLNSFEVNTVLIKTMEDIDVNCDGAVNANDAAAILVIAAKQGAGVEFDLNEELHLNG